MCRLIKDGELAEVLYEDHMLVICRSPFDEKKWISILKRHGSEPTEIEMTRMAQGMVNFFTTLARLRRSESWEPHFYIHEV